MELENVIIEFAKLANMAENEVNDLYVVEKDEEGNDVRKLADVNEAISKVKNATAAKFNDIKNNHYGRGLKEGASKFESYIKTQFDSEKQGTELLQDYLTHIESKSQKAKDKFTPEELKANPVVKQLVDAEVKALKEEKDRVLEELNGERNRYYTEKLTEKARGEAINVLEKIRWAKSDDHEQADKQKKAIFSLIDYSRLKLDGDKIILVDANGEAEKDQYHNPISFESYIEGLNPFGIHRVNPNQRSPQGQQGNPNAPALKIRSQQEYDEYIRKYPKNRLEAMRSFRAHLEGV